MLNVCSVLWMYHFCYIIDLFKTGVLFQISLAQLWVQIYQVQKLDPLVCRALTAASAVPDLTGECMLL